MNKRIKSAMMMASVGAMLCIVGCGESADSPEAIAKTSIVSAAQKEGVTCEVKVISSDIKEDVATVNLESSSAFGKMPHTVRLYKENGKWIVGDKREKTPEYIEYKKMMDKVPAGYGLSYKEKENKLEKFKTLSPEEQKKAMSELEGLVKRLGGLAN